MKYSIWVIPPEPIYSKVKTTINRLSGAFDGPPFDPHMTLLGEIDRDLLEIQQKVKKLVISLDTLELSLGPISFSTTYFQSVFVRINSTAILMQLNLDAKKLFGTENNVFMPHMSLLYGNHDMVTRQKAAASVDLPSSSFVVDKFVVSTTSGDPKDWKVIATIPLEK